MGMLVYRKNPQNISHKVFLSLGFLFGFIMFTQGCFHQSINIEEATLWWRCSSLWSINIAISYHFLALFTNQRSFITNFRKALLYSSAFVISVTDSLTPYISEVGVRSSSGWTVHFPMNIACISSQVWLVVMVFLLILIPFSVLGKSDELKRKQLIILLGGITIACVATVLDMWLTLFSVGTPAFSSILTVFPFLCLGLGTVIYDAPRSLRISSTDCRYCGSPNIQVNSHEGVCIYCLVDRIGTLEDKVNHVMRLDKR